MCIDMERKKSSPDNGPKDVKTAVRCHSKKEKKQMVCAEMGYRRNIMT
jgi:hypothetical protein